MSAATLDRLPQDVTRPAYDRASVKRGVVHLGIGAFHRAHQAVVFDAALALGDMRWGITGVSLRSGGVRDRLAPQDGLYTLVVRDADVEETHIIGAIAEVLVAPEDPAAVVAALAHPDTHIVTLTITEKGYGLDRATGALLADDPDVAADLAALAAPRTAPGFLVAGLARRRLAGLAPFTIVSCDNLPGNGALLRGAVLEMARARDPDLACWIADEAAFPATMVDRIVPAIADADVAALGRRLGLEDLAMVKTEPFCQWVVEDRFCGARPDFGALGVQLTEDVAPWEAAKLRLLNGAHSAIACLGGLAGDRFVHDFVARADGRRFVEALWDEAQATFVAPDGFQPGRYRQALMARFANPALQHRTRQIAMDGSQKVPQRLLEPMAWRRAHGLSIDRLSLAFAAWIRWQSGRTDDGDAYPVEDPIAARIARHLSGAGSARERVAAILALRDVVPIAIAGDPVVLDTTTAWLDRLERRGSLSTLAECP